MQLQLIENKYRALNLKSSVLMQFLLPSFCRLQEEDKFNLYRIFCLLWGGSNKQWQWNGVRPGWTDLSMSFLISSLCKPSLAVWALTVTTHKSRRALLLPTRPVGACPLLASRTIPISWNDVLINCFIYLFIG